MSTSARTEALPQHTRGRLRAGEVSLWTEQRGQGPVLLLITGLGYASWFWRELDEALSTDYRVIRFDNRGTGRSDKPAGPYSIDLLADDAAALLAACGHASAHVIGHSMGGYIAQTLALRHPTRVASLVLVGTAMGGPGCQPVPEETMTAWSTAASLSPADYARSTMPLSFAPGWSEQHPQQFEAYLAARLEHPTPSQNWTAQYQACEAFFAQGISAAAIRCPALVIHGTADRVVPYANGEQLAAALPNARLETWADAGHLPPLEHPDRFARQVRAFLQHVTAA